MMTDTVNNETIETAVEQAEPVKAAVVDAVKKVNARRVKTERKPRARKAPVARPSKNTTPRAAKVAPQIEDTTMNFNPTNSFTNFQPFAAVPGMDRLQNLFADAGSKGQEAIEKGRKGAEDMAELTRANVEAVVEAGKIAATGAKTVGEDALGRVREGIEQNVAELKSLAAGLEPDRILPAAERNRQVELRPHGRQPQPADRSARSSSPAKRSSRCRTALR